VAVIEYYYSLRGSFAYLGSARIRSLAREHGRQLAHKPILLSEIMGPIGAQPFDQRPPMRTAYARLDFLRWAEHLHMSVHADPIHHLGPMELPTGVVIAGQRRTGDGLPGDVDELSHLILEALWRDDRDIADETVISELCEKAGFDPDVLMGEALSDNVQLELARNCRDAITFGVHGSPTYFVDEEPFYGQDRLDFVARALATTPQFVR
jgi:2-hydroxychromene-2-carboxylate isomerase